jgi:hypothetical protein
MSNDYIIQRYEPNPHAEKQVMLKNRTYQVFRWKDILILNSFTRVDAEKYFSVSMPNLRGIYKYRLVCKKPYSIITET